MNKIVGIPYDHTKSYLENMERITGRPAPEQLVRLQREIRARRSPGIVDARPAEKPKRISRGMARLLREAILEARNEKR
jgi:hypothetical protein